MAVMGIVFPAALHFTHSELHYGKSALFLLRFSGCIMLVAYASYLVFQLNSHNNLYNPIGNEEEDVDHIDEFEAERPPMISKWEAVIWLAILTIWVSILSGYLVDAIQGASVSMDMPVAFISVILLPIVGNAAEHANAIMFAMKNKLDITLGVAFINTNFHVCDPIMCSCWLDHGTTNGLEFSVVRNHYAFHYCSCCRLHVAGDE